MAVDDLKAKIRDVPDFPEPGIVFKDIMPLLADPASLNETGSCWRSGSSPASPT